MYWLFFQGNICDVIKNIEYHDIVEDQEVILEHFRLLVNLSATNVAHDEIITGTQEYFRILTQAVSRQIQVLYMKVNFVVISVFFFLCNVLKVFLFLFCNCSMTITYMYYNYYWQIINSIERLVKVKWKRSSLPAVLRLVHYLIPRGKLCSYLVLVIIFQLECTSLLLFNCSNKTFFPFF